MLRNGLVFYLKDHTQKHSRLRFLLRVKGLVILFGLVWRRFKVITDRKNVTDLLYLVLHLACKVTCYFRLFSSVLVSVLRTSINVLSKSKSKNFGTWIANLTKLFLSVDTPAKLARMYQPNKPTQGTHPRHHRHLRG